MGSNKNRGGPNPGVLLVALVGLVWLFWPHRQNPETPTIEIVQKTAASEEVQYVEVPTADTRTVTASFLKGKQFLTDTCCRRVFTHTATYKTGNDNWFDMDLLLDNEVIITTTLTYKYRLSTDLTNAQIGNIHVDRGGQFGGDPKKNTHIPVFLPEPNPQEAVLVDASIELPETEVQNALEWLKNHGDDERSHRNFYLTSQALKDAQEAFSSHKILPWKDMKNHPEARETLKRMGVQLAEEIRKNFTQERGDMTWVRVEWPK